MVIGNRVILTCATTNKKMFPFDEDLPCLLQVGNKANIEHILDSVKSMVSEIIIIGINNPKLMEIANEYGCQLYIYSGNILVDIEACTNDIERATIISAEGYYKFQDLKEFILLSETGKNYVMLSTIQDDEKSIDYICANAKDIIHSFIPHARKHYVNAKSCKAYLLTKEILNIFKYTESGFSNINCGQMPPNDIFIIENAIQKAIEKQITVYPFYIESYYQLEFGWDIKRVNESYCQDIVSKVDKNSIDKSSIIDKSCIIKGNVIIGKNSVLENGVIIEGNCIIGENVCIRNNVILGKNTIIGNESILENNCKIANNSVIGSKNKIGFCAEITGVTMEGVCAIHNSEIFGVIGKYVDIAAGVQMGVLKFNDTMSIQNINGKKYQNQYTNSILIGNYTRTGIANLFYPGIKVGSRCALSPGLIVDQDIQKNSLVFMENTKRIVKSWGSDRYGW